MKKWKNNLDEMQELEALKTERRGFWIMYLGLAAAIVIQTICYKQDIFRYAAGETIVLCIGSFYSVWASLRKGIWGRHTAATAKANLVLSLICSGVFALIFGIISYVRLGKWKLVLESTGIFFVCMFVLCYAVLTVMLIVYRKRAKELEKEEEE